MAVLDEHPETFHGKGVGYCDARGRSWYEDL